jgi:hypothetical protein
MSFYYLLLHFTQHVSFYASCEHAVLCLDPDRRSESDESESKLQISGPKSGG